MVYQAGTGLTRRVDIDGPAQEAIVLSTVKDKRMFKADETGMVIEAQQVWLQRKVAGDVGSYPSGEMTRSSEGTRRN